MRTTWDQAGAAPPSPADASSVLPLEIARDTLVVVAARSGSRRLPRKNIRKLAGVPLIGWSLHAIRQSGLPDAYLSTDDPEFAEQGATLGFIVPFLRPASLAADDVPSVFAVLHLLEWYRAQHGREPAFVLMVPPTSPFRPKWLIREALSRLAHNPRAQRAIAVKRLGLPASAIYVSNDEMLASAAAMVEQPILVPTGAVYASKTEALKRDKAFAGTLTTYIEHSGHTTLDIDTPEDWDFAEYLCSRHIVETPQPGDSGGVFAPASQPI